LLKNIIAKIGYPTTKMVGKETSHQFFAMVQHSDADVAFQEKMLNTLSKEVTNGNVAAKDYALLTDRVQLALHKPQIYGTQVTYSEEGQATPKNLKDSTHVNQRRKKIGIKTLEEYLNKVTKTHFLMNKKMYENKGIMEPQLYNLKN